MNKIIFRNLGLCLYQATWKMMRDFTETRTIDTLDHIWLVEHFPVFTQGQAGKPEHLLAPGEIPVIKTDRGGQVTYHGPGQLIVYVLLDIRRKNLGVKAQIHALEHSIIALLADYGIQSSTRSNAPGVYVNQAKIASLGLRIRQGCSYHGLSLNVGMDLEPFSRINPCGYPNQTVSQMRDFKDPISVTAVVPNLVTHLMHYLGYTTLIEGPDERSHDNQSN